MVLTLDYDRAFQIAQEITTRSGFLDPGIYRTISAKRWRDMGGRSMNLTECIANELLKLVLAFCKLLRPPAAEIVGREALTK